MAEPVIRTKSVTTLVHPVGKIYQNLRAIWLGSPENLVYGNSSILSHYAGVKNRKIRGRYQHGWPAHSANDLYYKNDFLPTFTWNEEAEDAALRKGWKNFKSIGSPWLYLLEILRADGWDTNRREPISVLGKTLWVYGRHGLVDQSLPSEHLLNFLDEANLNSVQGDFCLLYFEDFDSLAQVDLKRFANLEIVTLGQRSSSFISDAHLVRLFHVLKSCSRINIDHPSTLALYALTLGIEINWIRNKTWLESLQKAKSLGLDELCEFMQSNSKNSLYFTEYASAKLGRSSLKSRSELRQVLGWGNFPSGLMASFSTTMTTLTLFPIRIMRNQLISITQKS